MKITAVIPVRAGSQRVKNKNLKPFGKSSLLAHKIDILKQVRNIDDIVVNTDSSEAIEIAKSKGVSFHRRADYFASSKCTNSEFLQHLGEVTETEIFAYCPCTTPFIKIKTIEDSIENFLTASGNDCLATVTLIKEFLWLNNNPLNYKREKQPNSQDLPDIYALNFGLNLINRQNLIKYKNIVGHNPIFRITDEIEGLDIDTPLDFFIAEELYKKMQENPSIF